MFLLGRNAKTTRYAAKDEDRKGNRYRNKTVVVWEN